MPDKKHKTTPIIQKTPDLCEWVELGVLSYKICTRQFECESCPLDRALRGYYDEMNDDTVEMARHHISAVSMSLAALKERLIKQQDEPVFVHPYHLWIRQIDENEVRIGIDELITTIMGSIDSIILPEKESQITRNKCCGEILQQECIFCIHAPVSGKVTRVNHDLLNMPNQLTYAPNDVGWMITVEPDNLEADLTDCYAGKSLTKWYCQEVEWLEIMLLTNIQQRYSEIGATLPDGGEPSLELKNYFPTNQYRHILSKLLGIASRNSNDIINV